MLASRASVFSRVMRVWGFYSERAELLLRAFANLVQLKSQKISLWSFNLKNCCKCPVPNPTPCDWTMWLFLFFVPFFYIVFILSLKNSMNFILFVFPFIYIILPSLAVFNGLGFAPLLKSLLHFKFCIHVGWMLTLIEILFSSVFLCGSLYWYIHLIICASQEGWSFILGAVFFQTGLH